MLLANLTKFLHSPTVAHWSACRRVLRYVKRTLNLGLSFRPAKELNLEGFADADWASNIDDRKSMSGICIFLGGNLINWSAKKQASVSRSSTESEYRALASAATEIVWMQQLLQELQAPLQMTPPVLWCNNLGAQALASNPVHHARTKHIEIDVHFIRDLVTSNKLDVRYISTLHQPADIFTKTLFADRFSFLCSKLNLESFQFSLRGPR